MRRWLGSYRKPPGRRGPLFLALAVVAAIGGSCQSASAPLTSTAAPNRATSINYVFFYQPIDPARDESKFRGAKAVVTAGQNDDRAAVATIHHSGALAIKYVQLYWLPAGRSYEGIDMAQHMDWAFCNQGAQPLAGRTEHGVSWYFFDANERAARNALFRYFGQLKKLGYDGLFFDRGSPSLRSSTGINMAWRQSSCTADPVSTSDRRFADVFANVVRQAKARWQFHVYINYGHPFSGFRLRPDPNDPACRQRGHRGCHYLNDLSHALSGVIDESALPVTTPSGFAQEVHVDAAEAAAAKAGKAQVIRGVKVLAGAKEEAYLRWSIPHLFDLPTFIGTGDDGCATGPCNRNGTYPELTDANLGKPSGAAPHTEGCVDHSSSQCLWVRTFSNGVVVVNATPSPATQSFSLPGHACRRVLDVYRGAWSHECKRAVDLNVPRLSGRVFVFAGR